MTFAITGATGRLGRLVIDRLKDKVSPAEIVALARTPAKASDLGVTVREADYEQPETLEQALSGADTLLLISSSEVGRRADQHHNVIEAAKKAGVKRIVYTSLLHADTSPLDLAAEISRQTGKNIPFKNLSGADYAALLTGFCLPERLAQAIAGWDTAASQGALFDDSRRKACSRSIEK